MLEYGELNNLYFQHGCLGLVAFLDTWSRTKAGLFSGDSQGEKGRTGARVRAQEGYQAIDKQNPRQSLYKGASR